MATPPKPKPCFVCAARLAPFLFGRPGGREEVATCEPHRKDGRAWLARANAEMAPPRGQQGSLL